ncbi:MAG TPA: hypothetical protein VKB51_07570 [bacterium]|nr:hypothetical protein [bacterium]
MVTPTNPSAEPRGRATPGRPAPRTARALRAFARTLAAALPCALLLATLLGAAPQPAAAQSSTLYFLTVKHGVADASGSGENLFQTLATVHGPVQGARGVQTGAIELDIYSVSQGNAGLGVGIEVLGYDHAWLMQDGLKVHMRAKGVLFTFKTFLRLGNVFPFFGAGLGNYYVNFDESPGGPSLRDSPDAVYNVRVGTRILFGRLGLLLEAGNTRAQLPILTDAGRATLEAGGNYANAGLSWVF